MFAFACMPTNTIELVAGSDERNQCSPFLPKKNIADVVFFSKERYLSLLLASKFQLLSN